MITIKRSILIPVIMVSLIIGSLTAGLPVIAADRASSVTKYDYTILTGFTGSINQIEGKDGEIKYSDKLKKLLDDGWRIHSISRDNLILEKVR